MSCYESTAQALTQELGPPILIIGATQGPAGNLYTEALSVSCLALDVSCMTHGSASKLSHLSAIAGQKHKLVSMQERDAVLATVASVLHLGNISFHQGDMDNAELLDEKSEDAMYAVSHLMQVSPLTFCTDQEVVSVRHCMLHANKSNTQRCCMGGLIIPYMLCYIT